ncbi:Short-chain dehydrogenase [Cupriavidus sp. YR651]|uniref:SDR family oxidoreductase n=1 Tax=Cupriavidus sp. YR651 TaxID=1855315 RepID=UPI00088841A4|nr:SDR family oxidoreductase [Cupriavidus sp. YR651]SDD95901.1 Short-chain dehydrogenase [Cupriavidus sp. YR651]
MQETVLISGGNSGMGLSTSLLLARRGYRVFAGARSDAGLATIRQEAGEQELQVTPVRLDVQDTGSVAAAVDHVLVTAGRLDVVVNNAGFGLVASVEDGTDEEFIRQFDVNVFGVLRLIRAAVPAMRRAGRGVVVNVGSFLGHMGLPLLTHYNASKYAVEGISDSLRLELSPFGIRVHTVAPGLFRTGFANRGLAANARTTASDSPYADVAGRLLPLIANHINEGPNPKAVADAVLYAIEAQDAPARIPVGEEALRADDMKRNLEPAEFEAAVRQLYGLTAPNHPK